MDVPVSRETERVEDRVVDEWFGTAAPLARRYAEALGTDGVRRGVIGPHEISRIWTRHLLNCAVVHPLIGRASAVGDLGSGAGLPGIVLALARPDLSVTLIEPLLRRTRFLDDTLAALGLPNVRVVRSRAEDLIGAMDFDVVVARAVAPLDRLAEWALPLCRAGGELLAVKGSSAAEELASARPALGRLRAGAATIHRCGIGVVEPPTTVVRIQSHAPTPNRKGCS